MPIGAIIGPALGAAGAIGGALISADASSRAADAQQAAAREATAARREMYDQTRTDLAPYRGLGEGATYSLADLYGLPTPSNPNGGQPFGQDAIRAFESSPDYQFALDQGIKARDRSAAAKGRLLSGGQIKAITDYGQGLATQNFGNYANRLMDLARLGETAGAQTGSYATQTGQGLASDALAGGEAAASGIVGQANAINTGLGQISDISNFYAGLSNPSSYQSISNWNPNTASQGFIY